jgi:hypothetical protein
MLPCSDPQALQPAGNKNRRHLTGDISTGHEFLLSSRSRYVVCHHGGAAAMERQTRVRSPPVVPVFGADRRNIDFVLPS